HLYPPAGQRDEGAAEEMDNAAAVAFGPGQRFDQCGDHDNPPVGGPDVRSTPCRGGRHRPVTADRRAATSPGRPGPTARVTRVTSASGLLIGTASSSAAVSRLSPVT